MSRDVMSQSKRSAGKTSVTGADAGIIVALTGGVEVVAARKLGRRVHGVHRLISYDFAGAFYTGALHCLLPGSDEGLDLERTRT